MVSDQWVVPLRFGDVMSGELGSRKQESGIGNQELGIRNWESGIRGQVSPFVFFVLFVVQNKVAGLEDLVAES